MDTNDKISKLITQYGAESLPEEVKDSIPDFFMESIHVSEQIESLGRNDVSEAVPEEDIIIGSNVDTNGEPYEGGGDVVGAGDLDTMPALRNVLDVGKEFPKAQESPQMTKSLIKSEPNDQRKDAIVFIRNYAEQHALQLPGRYVSPKGQVKDLFHLPAIGEMTRKYIYDQYMICCRGLKREGVSFLMWKVLWALHLPNVMVPKNKYEICRECREQHISKSEPFNENLKLRSSEEYLKHLIQIEIELNYYKFLVDECQQSAGDDKPSPAIMHYTFDWYTTVSLPYSSRLSSIYFFNGYKVSLFGVCIEPLEKFYLYIIPEFVIGNGDKLPDITVSLINHFFTNFALNESQTYIHFGDSCVKQSKNNHILSYFMWRSATNLSEKITISYMPSGHSKCWNDLFMGVFKKKFRDCDVNCLQDIYQIAERCTGASNSIKPVLVGNDSGEIEFPLLYWNEKFSHINNLDTTILQNNNHFEISNEFRGLVRCRRFFNSDTISYALIANKDLDYFSGDLPECLEIEGMAIERKVYLHENIHEFTPTQYQSLICPDPQIDCIKPDLQLHVENLWLQYRRLTGHRPGIETHRIYRPIPCYPYGYTSTTRPLNVAANGPNTNTTVPTVDQRRALAVGQQTEPNVEPKSQRSLECEDIDSSEGMNQCEECVENSSQLNQNEGLKTNVKPFGCDWPGCDYRAKTKQVVKTHLNVHKYVRNYECIQFECHKKFKTNIELKNHVLRHNTEKTFVCDYNGCGKRFTTKAGVRIHKRIHLGRKFKCDYNNCNEEFATNYALERHKRSHTGEKPYICTQNDCNKRFSEKYNLNAHVKRRHE